MLPRVLTPAALLLAAALAACGGGDAEGSAVPESTQADVQQAGAADRAALLARAAPAAH